MILLLGPTGCGKTTLTKLLSLFSVQKKPKEKSSSTANKFEIDELPPVQPTVGTNITRLSSSQRAVEIREVGGCMIPIWKSYYADAKAIIFMIDASHSHQVSSSCILLRQVLSSPDTRTIPFLILFNKIDIPSKTSLNEIKYLLQINNIVKNFLQTVTLLDISCKEKAGLGEIIKWVTSNRF